MIVAEPLATVAEFEAPGHRPRVQTLRELSATPYEAPEGLWGPWIVPGEMTSTAGRGGKGKTTLTRCVLCHGAKGGSYLGLNFARPVISLYLSGEGSAAFFRAQIESVADALALDDAARERIYIADGGGDCGLKLSRPDHVDTLRGECDALVTGPGLDLLVLDPFFRFMLGDENASVDMGRAVEAILELQREFGFASWVPHHASQAGRGLDAFRGHTSFEGAIATGLVLTSEDADRRKLDPVKVRYAQEPADTTPRFLRFEHEGRVYVEDAGALTTRERLVRELADGEWHKVAELAEALEVTRQTLTESHIDPMVEVGKFQTEKREHGARYVRQPREGEALWSDA